MHGSSQVTLIIFRTNLAFYMRMLGTLAKLGWHVPSEASIYLCTWKKWAVSTDNLSFSMKVLQHLCQGALQLIKAIFPSGAIASKVSPRSCGSMFFNWSANMDPQLQKAASPQVLRSSCLGR